MKNILLSLLFVVAVSNFLSAQNILQVADSFFYQSDWKAAKEKYAMYLRDTSTNAIAWNRLGYCNYNMGMYEEAVKSYEKALGNKPSPQLKFIVESRLAKVYAKENKNDASVNWLNKAIGDGYTNIHEMDSSSDFESLRNTQAFKDARQKAFIIAYPCSADVHSRQFDFWIGEWDVYQTGTKNLVGHSIIQSISGGCAILENWTSLAGAHNGKSINYYDTLAKAWEQDWVGSSGDIQRFTNGRYENEKMMFTYTTKQNGQKAFGNFIFYNLGADKVRQYQDVSVDDGKTFQVSYDFTYIRKK
ncbi:MAG: tetratricopeptide repeat protein [Bacteroidetes bacterium]|nr:tetratricopeptide repeat protein [Bacteroidota bacterium]